MLYTGDGIKTYYRCLACLAVCLLKESHQSLKWVVDPGCVWKVGWLVGPPGIYLHELMSKMKAWIKTFHIQIPGGSVGIGRERKKTIPPTVTSVWRGSLGNCRELSSWWILWRLSHKQPCFGTWETIFLLQWKLVPKGTGAGQGSSYFIGLTSREHSKHWWGADRTQMDRS